MYTHRHLRAVQLPGITIVSLSNFDTVSRKGMMASMTVRVKSRKTGDSATPGAIMCA